MKRLHFKSKATVPPGRFNYLHTETGHISSSHSYDQWLGKIASHREANNLPPITPEDAEHQNCMRLAPATARSFCNAGDGDFTTEAVQLKFADIMRGTRTIAAFKLAGSPLVSNEEAERRAAICRLCEWNTPYASPCGTTCAELTSLVETLVGGEKTSYDEDLRACAICHCSLKAKIHIPLEILRKTEEPAHQELFPPFCWQKAE